MRRAKNTISTCFAANNMKKEGFTLTTDCKTKKANNFIVEPREIKIDVTGHEQKPEPKVPALTIEQTHKRQSSCVSSHRGSSNNGAVSTLTKKSSDQKVEMNWELQQDVEQAEFRQQRKRRAKKCFPFSICA